MFYLFCVQVHLIPYFMPIMENVLNLNSNQIQLRGFRTRAHGTLFHKLNNDIMTIKEFKQSQRVSFLLKGLIGRQRPFLFYSPKKIAILKYRLPNNFFMCLSVQHCYFILFAYNYRQALLSTYNLMPSKLTTAIQLLLISTIYYRNVQARPTYC